MPVLIEGVSVVLRKGAIYERYQGGYGHFLYELNGHNSLTTCNQLMCIQFDNHEQARGYLKFLTEKGMRIGLMNIPDPLDTDAVLVDQVFGPSIRVWWLDFITLNQRTDITRSNNKTPKKDKALPEKIVVAATNEEMDDREELRLKSWNRDEIAFPEKWDYKESKSFDLEFLRMAENRSFRDH
jgi:hypothetical protein